MERPLPSDHPWSTARWEFDNRVIPILEKHGREIGENAKAGNEDAKEIVKWYTMLYKSFDPMSFEFLKRALQKYGYEVKPIRGRDSDLHTG